MPYIKLNNYKYAYWKNSIYYELYYNNRIMT
jgi:hypothetical protein